MATFKDGTNVSEFVEALAGKAESRRLAEFMKKCSPELQAKYQQMLDAMDEFSEEFYDEVG